MKIIKRGVNPRDKEYKASCINCGTVLTFFASEVQRVPDQRDGDFFSFPCPVCAHTITKAVR